jgi:hypothetical protein
VLSISLSFIAGAVVASLLHRERERVMPPLPSRPVHVVRDYTLLDRVRVLTATELAQVIIRMTSDQDNDRPPPKEEPHGGPYLDALREESRRNLKRIKDRAQPAEREPSTDVAE